MHEDADAAGVSTSSQRQPVGPVHYSDIVEPAAALEALEVELNKLVCQAGQEGENQDLQAICEAVCLLIKEECDAEVCSVAALLVPSFLHDCHAGTL
jgi:hypothetical protein